MRIASQKLSEIAKEDARVEFYEFEPENEEFGVHWLHLHDPWATKYGSIHERTVRECLDSLRLLPRMAKDCVGFDS